MIVLFVVILAHPLFGGPSQRRLVVSVFMAFVVFTAALAVLRQPTLLLAVCGLGVPWVVLSLLTGLVDVGLTVELVRSVIQIVFLLLLLAIWVANILTAPTVSLNVLCRAVSAYLIIGIAWASMYYVLVLFDPNAIEPVAEEPVFTHYVYFSFTTLTTLGYGDVTPVSLLARSLVMVEAIVGTMYVATTIARLVSMYKVTPVQAQASSLIPDDEPVDEEAEGR